MYESLTELIPDCDVTSEYGTWVDSSNGKGTSDNQPTMPHVSPGPAMRRYEQRVYAFVEEHQELGFYKYQDILNASGINWDFDSMNAADVTKLDGRTIVALLLATLRADRFCEGALLSFFESGAIKRWLLRLKEINDEAITVKPGEA